MLQPCTGSGIERHHVDIGSSVIDACKCKCKCVREVMCEQGSYALSIGTIVRNAVIPTRSFLTISL